ncbi:MAG: hypothetical protein H7144_00695 [Burkholderiales bacterium]|nr:hypothetical protein [Phycisphaerae bacterium]
MGDELLPKLNATRKTGCEPFHDDVEQLPFNLLNFWQWSASDLASNALRGRVAEFLVAQALGVAHGVRSEWDAYDLLSNSGATIEVKSSAYLQTWTQNAHSTVAFHIAPTRAWTSATNAYETDARRQADIYVFALLAHRQKDSLDPMDVSQWRFFVLPAKILNVNVVLQKTIRLERLRALKPIECAYKQLGNVIDAVSRELKSSEG